MPINIDEAGLAAIFPEIEEIQDPTLRRGVVAIWLEIVAECPWDRWRIFRRTWRRKNTGASSTTFAASRAWRWRWPRLVRRIAAPTTIGTS
ncbi:MAG TPA: hypothetical protein VGN83_06445 [Falsiroseomonas sp.]|nr:hypothetical protein [Falsiroseomonas sp.]